MTAATTIRDAALAYAARGWHVVPLRPREKLPLLPGWTGIALEHGADKDYINAWWTRQPDANLGLLTGHASGVVVVDVDPRNGGSFDHPTAPFVRTGSGGYHYFFAHPGGTTRVYSKTGKNGIGPGLELKADGGHQVVAAPSIHPLTGEAYAWVRPEGELPPLPAEILALAGTYDASAAAAEQSALADRGDVDFPLADLDSVVAGCGWMRACRDDAASISEPEWYASLSVLAQCEGGHEAAHAWGAGHPGYSYGETSMKLDRAASASGPARCSRVAREGWGGGACASCPHLAKDASPYSLGTPMAVAMSAPVDPVAAFADVPLTPAAVVESEAPAAGADIECALSKKTPLTTARRFLSQTFQPGQLRFFDNLFYKHNGTHFKEYSETWLMGDLYRFCEHHFSVTPADVTSVVHALKHSIESRAETLPAYDPPAAGDPVGTDIIPFTNGVLDIGDGTIFSHTPRWLSRTCLPYAYDPNATCPQWEAFLRSLWDGEDGVDAVLALQMWFGYALTSDTRQQKFAVLVGEPRSGKSTIGRTLRQLIGVEAVAAPRLSNLGKDFGLASLLGMQHTIFYDAHCAPGGGESDNVLEVLKSIVGEDPVEINRKYIKQVTVRLQTRITMVANELPSFRDASGSLVHRMLTWRFTRSFAGLEDHGLEDKLAKELPGICNWALRGLAEFRKVGRLRQCRLGLEVLEEARRQGSPMHSFVSDCTNYPGVRADSTTLDELWSTYQRYCQQQNTHGLSRNRFDARIQTVCPIARIRGGKVTGMRVGPRNAPMPVEEEEEGDDEPVVLLGEEAV